MAEFVCLMCDHRFNDIAPDHCPKCGNPEIMESPDGESVNWEDGHFEGDMGPSRKHDNSIE